MPLPGERGDVPPDAGQSLFGDIAGERDGVQSSGADRRVGQQGIHIIRALLPALGEDAVFEDGDHQAGVTHLLYRSGLHGAQWITPATVMVPPEHR